EGVVEHQQLAFTGPARFLLPLDGSGAIAVNRDGTIDAEWFLRDADGDWKPWRNHRYSPLPSACKRQHKRTDATSEPPDERQQTMDDRGAVVHVRVRHR